MMYTLREAGDIVKEGDMQPQYRLSCCGRICESLEMAEDEKCPYCKAPVGHLEEVDKEDRVFPYTRNFSGDKAYERRPWGSFTVLLDEPNIKVKKIIVKPKAKLSLLVNLIS